MIKVALLDCGVGNINSLFNMLEYLGHEITLIDGKSNFVNNLPLILPGTGHFDSVISALDRKSLLQPLEDNLKNNLEFRYLGICVGAQILLESSEEGNKKGLSVLSGSCNAFESITKTNLDINMGWKDIDFSSNNKILKNINKANKYYFVHSYYMDAIKEHTLAKSVFGGFNFASVVGIRNILGCQFHPEKSGTFGMEFLQNFLMRDKK